MKCKIHCFERMNATYYRCIAPSCTSYFHKKLLNGKQAICPYCGSEFNLTSRDLRKAKPHCGCTTVGHIPEQRIMEALDKLLGEKP